MVKKYAMLLIDLQQAFLPGGCWAGYDAESAADVAPIEEAFRRTRNLLSSRRFQKCKVVCLCSRCPFPGENFDPPEYLADLLKSIQVVIKPSTDVMAWNNGFAEWMQCLIQDGVDTLVVGGCTTTSCVRVSSTSIQRAFKDRGLQVIVDLSLCGARKENHVTNSSENFHLVRLYGKDLCTGKSPVDLAVHYMQSHGVRVVESFEWPEN